ncbi:MAG TPA: SCO family protein, partial [Microvirga sp.]|nr:SCO family protein [Microvirga sp.]
MILKRSLLVPLAVFLVAALTLLATLLLLLPGPQPSASKVPIGGPFRLTSHEGKAFTDEDLKGKPFAVFFGFTHCPEV